MLKGVDAHNAFRRQKTLKVSAAMCGRPILASVQPDFEVNKDSNSLLNEPSKPRPDENDRSVKFIRRLDCKNGLLFVSFLSCNNDI
jgi:hypothetical protein